MRKLSEAQRRVLCSAADGELHRCFDVYAGYWWTERGKRQKSYGRSEHYPPLPVRALLECGLIKLGETTRPYSGAQQTPYTITPAGRAALEASNAQ